jgi:hypothetical protein
VCRIYAHIVEINNCLNYLVVARRKATPVVEMWRTRKSSSEMANTHFSWLKARSLAARMANNAQRGIQCCPLDLLETPSASSVVPDGGNAGGGDAVNQETQFRYCEHALLHVEGQAVGGEDGEQRAERRSVLLSGFAEDPVTI